MGKPKKDRGWKRVEELEQNNTRSGGERERQSEETEILKNWRQVEKKR